MDRAAELRSGMAATLVSSPTGLPSASSGVPAAGQCAVEAEAGEGAVDVAAGADALDDLLAEVAALAEVEGAGLGGLLGEVAVADVGAVERGAFEDAEQFEGLRGRRGRRRAVVRAGVRSAMVTASAQSSKRGREGCGRG